MKIKRNKNILKIVLLNVVFFLFHSSFCYCQEDYFSLKFKLEVKQLDEFFKRFDTTDVSSKSNNLNLRTNEIYHLLNLSNYKLSISESNFQEFIKEVVKNNIKLNYIDSNWYAEVNCNVTYHHKNYDMNLTLKMSGDNNKGYKWVICGVEPKIFQTNKSNDSTKFISPGDNELDFMDLRKVFEDYKNIENYIFFENKIDYLSIFIYAVKNKELTFNHTNFIIYHLLEIKNWIVTVQNYNRKDYNSGWLISNLIKANTTQKGDYKNKMLSVKF